MVLVISEIVMTMFHRKLSAVCGFIIWINLKAANHMKFVVALEAM
jgi:hypothetical protein